MSATGGTRTRKPGIQDQARFCLQMQPVRGGSHPNCTTAADRKQSTCGNVISTVWFVR